MSDTQVGEAHGLPSHLRDKIAEYRDVFWRDGVVHIPAALCGSDLELARSLFDWSNMHHSPAAFEAPMGEDGHTVFIDTHNANGRDEYVKILPRTSMPAIAAAVMGVDRLWFLGEQIFIKRGGSGSRPTPWHQDSDLPFDHPHGAMGMWMAFEELDAETCLEFVRSTHLGPSYNSMVPSSDGTGSRLLYPNATDMPVFPDIDSEREQFDIISWQYRPGDLILFHTNTIHGGGRVPPGGERNTLCLRFFDEDLVFEERPVREANGNQAAEATGYMWEGMKEGQAVHTGAFFTEVFDSKAVAQLRAIGLPG